MSVQELRSMLEYRDVDRAGMKVPDVIFKRDGRIVPFDIGRIERALTRCFASFERTPQTPVPELARRVVNIITARTNGTPPSVEGVQDIVEMVLQAAGEFDAAKRYILYRAEHARKREMRPIPEDVRRSFAQSAQYFPTPLQKFQFFDKYARFNYELGRRETWIETVDRTIQFFYELAGSALSAETYERLRHAILEMRVMPSMRLLAMAGPAARRSHVTIYNCSYQPVESIASFVEALIISMSGCGVGYSVESKYVENFPRIKRQSGLMRDMFVVPDSAEGWAEALRIGLETWFEGGDVRFDFSQLRPAGAPLRTKGGRASGPEPLRHMLKFIRSRILARQGSFLRPLDAHDMMCAVGNAAVSGGMRRTAMISLFDYDDVEMQQCKNGDFERENSQRWNANNSAVWPEGGFTQTEFSKRFLEMVESGRGEPGIFNRESAIAMRPARRKPAEFGTNPCVTGDTWVHTEFGPMQVGALVGQHFVALVDGQQWRSTSDGFWYTGTKPVYEITTEEGYTLRVTADHPLRQVTHQSHKTQREEWTAAGDLRSGDVLRLHNHRGASWEALDHGSSVGWLLGLLVSDGMFTTSSQQSDQAIVRFGGACALTMAEMAHAFGAQKGGGQRDIRVEQPSSGRFWQVALPNLTSIAVHYGIVPGQQTITPQIEATSSDFCAGFLRGLFDSGGMLIERLEQDVQICLRQPNRDLLRAAQRMLLRLGIVSTISEHRCDEGYELTIASDNIQEFSLRVGFSSPAKAARLRGLLATYRHIPNCERFTARVAAVTYIGEEPVYDCAIPGINAFDANGLYVHNCGEIILRPYEFCNLSSAIARVDDTFETLRDKVEVATIVGTIQSMATYFPGLRPQWRENCEEERLLGVDITGQMDSPIAQDAGMKAKLRDIAIDVNHRIAHRLGINPSASVTCVKPSGNSSQLVDCASGLHARWAPYYIRNVRVAAYSPVFKVLRDCGVPMDPENGQTPEDANTWVVHFPVKAPDGAVTRNDRSAIDQCEYWLQNKLDWTEHNPSCTITYRPDEVLDLMKWVWQHRDVLGGITFLPAFDANYEQMPYEEITKETFERLVAEFPPIDFSKIYRYEDKDLTNIAQEVACFSGSCELDI
jgi:ribonucleotide reductase alpha subunit